MAFFFTVNSRVLDGDTLKGFSLIDESNLSVNFRSLDDIKNVVARYGDNIQFTNAVWDNEYKTLVGKPDSLTAYPAVDSKGKLITKGGITVARTILDKSTNSPIGCICFNALGERFNLTYDKILNLCMNNNANNFKFVKGNSYIVKKDGTEFEGVVMSKKDSGSSRIYNSNLGESVSVKKVDNSVKDNMPTMKVYDLNAIKNSQFNQSAQDKLFRAVLNLSKLTPYYNICLQGIKRKPAVGLGTMGVTEDTLYYDLEFVSKLSVSELTFVLIHEMCHIAMQHAVRFRGKDSHYFWNIATDLYINSIICKDFDLSVGVEKNFGTELDPITIKPPENGVYLEVINEILDLAKDTPETIYNRLLEENSQQSQQSQGQGQGQGQQSQQGQGQNQQSQQNQSQQGQGQQSQQGQGQGQQEEKPDWGDSNPNSQQSSGSGSDSNSQDQGNNEGGNTKEVNVKYNGKNLTGNVNMDVMSNGNCKSKEDFSERLEESKNALQKINTKREIYEEETGNKLLSHGGAGALTQRYIDFGLSQNVSWQVLLRNLCKKNPKKTFTLAQPNQRYFGVNTILADRRKIGKPTTLSGVVFAIDVSGSISKPKLDMYLSEINNIFNYYKVDGELIYWSTEIGSVGNFTEMKDLIKIQPTSTGGTDVKCVFDYLTRKVKVNGKAESLPLREIQAVFIITDGCFSNNYEMYKEYFSKKVIWLIDGNPVTFNPPFGKVIGLKENS